MTGQQRIGVLIDWYRVLNSKERDDRFRAWGVINDPGCCVPGSEGCPAKSAEDTFGFDWCPGDASGRSEAFLPRPSLRELLNNLRSMAHCAFDSRAKLMDRLIRDDDTTVYGDKGYASGAKKRAAEVAGCFGR